MSANLLLLLVGAIWGMGFVAQSTAMDAIEPIFFTGIRFLAAAIAVLPLAMWEQRKAKNKALKRSFEHPQWASYLLLGTILFASLATQQIGLLTTTVTNSGFLTGLYVVMTPILAVTLFRQKPHWIIWPAALLTLTGIFLLSGGRLGGLTTGDYYTILCALLWAFHVLTLGRVLKTSGEGAQPFTLACSQFFVCALWGIGISLIWENPTFTSVVNASPEILFAGVVSGGVAFTLQAIGQRYTTAPQASIFMSSEALFAALFGALILGDRIAAIGLFGCGLIFIAMLIVEIVPALKSTRRTQIL